MGFGDADESFRLGFRKTLTEVSEAHARIDHHRGGADLEQGKRECEEFRTRRCHQNRPHTSADANHLQAASQSIAFLVELVVSKLMEASMARDNDGRSFRLRLGHRGQMVGNIDKGGVGHKGRICDSRILLFRMIVAPTRVDYGFFASGRMCIFDTRGCSTSEDFAPSSDSVSRVFFFAKKTAMVWPFCKSLQFAG